MNEVDERIVGWRNESRRKQSDRACLSGLIEPMRMRLVMITSVIIATWVGVVFTALTSR